MDTSHNPYAPPAAQVESLEQIGEVSRAGRLVEMPLAGQLPPRCVHCNAAAPSSRVARTLFWLAPAWRWSLLAVALMPVALALSGVLAAAILILPVALLAAIVNVIVRRKIPVALAVCERHRRQQQALTWAAWLSIAAVIGGAPALIATGQGSALFVLVTVMLLLGIVRSRAPALGVRIARLSGERLWLRGTGKAFRESLPETAGR